MTDKQAIEATDPLPNNPYRDKEGCWEATCFRRGWDDGRASLRTELESLRAENERLREAIRKHVETWKPFFSTELALEAALTRPAPESEGNDG